jgi:hypothetical protein
MSCTSCAGGSKTVYNVQDSRPSYRNDSRKCCCRCKRPGRYIKNYFATSSTLNQPFVDPAKFIPNHGY